MAFLTQTDIWKLMDEAHKETVLDIKKKIANGEELSEIDKSYNPEWYDEKNREKREKWEKFKWKLRLISGGINIDEELKEDEGE